MITSSVLLLAIYAECRVFIALLSVIFLNVVMLNVILLNVVMLCVIVLSVVALVQIEVPQKHGKSSVSLACK